MKLTKTDRYLLAAMGCTHIIPQTPSKETSMTDLKTLNTQETTMSEPQYPWQPLSPAHRSHGHELDTWIKTMQKGMSSNNKLYGRIINTGINYIVKGYNVFGEWKSIPCRDIHTAKLYLDQIMPEPMFRMHCSFVWRNTRFFTDEVS